MAVPTASPVVLDALSASTRRVALAELRERGRATSIDALASALASRAAESVADAESDPETSWTALYHVHLPVLAEAGAVTFDPETELVAAATGEPFDEPWVERLIADHPEPRYDPTLAALASERRQFVLYELLANGPTDDRALAVAVAGHERASEPEAVPHSVADVVWLSLRHTHLPVLADAGFVESDGRDGTVRAVELPWRSDPWAAASPLGEWPAVG
ncbi:MAG: hypothetical protein ABEJ26_10760 [Halosimplex sp.]